MGNRYPVPLGGNDQERNEWRDKIVAEAAERLYGVMEVAQGRLPLPEAERNAPSEKHEAAQQETKPVPAATAKEEPKEEVAQQASGIDLVAEALGGSIVEEAKPAVKVSFAKPAKFPTSDELGFIAPDDALVNRVRALCEKAGVMTETTAISNWLERALGVRVTRRIHAPVLEEFLNHYEALPAEEVRAEVLSS